MTHYSHLRLTNGETLVVHDDMTFRELREELKRKGATEYEAGVCIRYLLEPPEKRRAKERLMSANAGILSRA